MRSPMLRSFLFLELKQVKNWFRQAKEEPKKLLPVIFMGGALIIMLIALIHAPQQEIETQIKEVNIFLAILFGIGLVFVGTVLLNGIFKSTILFKKADVNFLFTAPVAPQTVLIFGMVRSFYTYILSTLFILYQAANLRSLGITLGQIILLMLVAAWSLFISGICGMLLYAKTLGNSMKRTAAVILVAVLLLGVVAWFGWLYYSEGFAIKAAVDRFTDSPLLVLYPFVGWMVAPMQWVILGPTVWNILGTVIFLIAAPLMMFVMYRTPVDYYEDAINLMAAKQGQEIQRHGSFSEQLEVQRQMQARKARVRRSGFGKGSGAKLLFYRLQKEEARLHRLPYWVRMLVPPLLLPVILFVANRTLDLKPELYAKAPGALLFVFLLASFFSTMRSSLITLYTEDSFLLLPLKPSQKFFYITAFDLADRFMSFFPPLLMTAAAAAVIAGENLPLMLFYGLMSALYLLSLYAWLMLWQIIIFRLMGDLGNMISVTLFMIGHIFMGIAFFSLVGYSLTLDPAGAARLYGFIALSGLIPLALLMPLGTSLLKRGRR